MKLSQITAGIVLVVIATVHATVNAQTIDASVRGRYQSNVNSPQVSYLSGFDGSVESRDYFVFSIPTGSFAAATLHLFNPAGGFSSVDASETLTVFDFTSANIGTLGSSSAVNYTDLGTGVSFGSFTASNANNNSFIDISLNAAGLAAVNAAAGSQIAFGGTITTLGVTTPGSQQRVFGSTGTVPANNTQLVLSAAAVPEPGEWAVIGMSALSVGGLMLKAQRRGR